MRFGSGGSYGSGGGGSYLSGRLSCTRCGSVTRPSAEWLRGATAALLCVSCRMRDAAERREITAEKKRAAARAADVASQILPFGKNLAAAFPYESADGETKYQCRLYTDGSTDCDCSSWTRQRDADGSRSCTHTEDVDKKKANLLAVLGGAQFGMPVVGMPTQPEAQAPTPQPISQPIRRMFDLSL